MNDFRSDIGLKKTGQRERIVAVATDLATGLRSLVEAIPGGPHRPMSLARTLKINKESSSRILGALEKADPLATLYFLPGPTPLMTFVEAAAKNGVPANLVGDARSSVRELAQLLQTVAGDKTGLDAMIGGWLPEARGEVEATARQLAFRGTSIVKGLTADVLVASFLVHPSASNPTRADQAVVAGQGGLRRLRPGVRARLIVTHRQRREEIEKQSSDDTRQIASPFLREFSTQPLPVKTVEHHGTTEYWLDDRGVGPSSAVNLYVTEIQRNYYAVDRLAGDETPKWHGMAYLVDIPSKALLIDVMLHRSVWPGCAPELRVYDIACAGPADPNDRSRDADIMSTSDVVRSLGTGLANLHVGTIPEYVEMLHRACALHGWKPEEFRAYRCQAQYPLYGWEYILVFNPFGAE